MIPFAAHPWNEIVPNLWQGGHYIASTSNDLEVNSSLVTVDDEFDAVYTMAHAVTKGHGPRSGVDHYTLPLEDSDLITRWQLLELRRIVSHIVLRVNIGEKILIRCEAGYNRSGLVVGMSLLRMGISVFDACNLIRKNRSIHALSNEYFVQLLHEEQDYLAIQNY